jgi:hypothetical protein
MDIQLDYAYRSVYQHLEQDFPDLIERIYPRKLQHTDKWPSPKYLAGIALDTALAANYDFVINGYIDKVIPHVYYSLGKLIECHVPTYFVYPELLAALRTTRFPDDMTLQDLRWAHDAVLFVIPRQAIATPDAGDCWYLGIAKTSAKSPAQILPRIERNALITSTDWVTTFAYIYGGQSYAWGHYLNSDPLDIGWRDPTFDTMTYEEKNGEIIIGSRKPFENETLFNHQMITLTLQLLMVMTARPDLAEGQILVRPGKQTSSGLKPEIWKPNFLGKTYAVRKEWQGGTHDSPRAHPREGHWRNYRVMEGKPWKHEQILWIEPTFVFSKT